MIRVRVPGGVSAAEQYLAVDQLADKYANGTIKLTTRQAYQLHGVLKKNLKTTIQGMGRGYIFVSFTLTSMCPSHSLDSSPSLCWAT